MDMRAIDDSKLALIKELYYRRLLSVPQISKVIGASVRATYTFFRLHHLERRTHREEREIRFQKKEPSFTKKSLDTEELRTLAAIGSMLYWGEGYKGSVERPAHIVDFANSDPDMILLFLRFLRSIYHIDEKKLRIYMYCYSDQSVPDLMSFWSGLTGVPMTQFTKPFVRSDFSAGARKMRYGLVHIRYGDKKLLLDIKSMIDFNVRKYAPIV